MPSSHTVTTVCYHSCMIISTIVLQYWLAMMTARKTHNLHWHMWWIGTIHDSILYINVRARRLLLWPTKRNGITGIPHPQTRHTNFASSVVYRNGMVPTRSWVPRRREAHYCSKCSVPITFKKRRQVMTILYSTVLYVHEWQSTMGCHTIHKDREKNLESGRHCWRHNQRSITQQYNDNFETFMFIW